VCGRSYSDIAIYLYMQRGVAATMATHQLQAPNGSTVTLPDVASYYQHTAPILDLLRAVTPLTWGRWITSGGKTGKYGPVTAALYGNNKEWHVQWVEVLGMASGKTLADDLTMNSGRVVWQGAGEQCECATGGLAGCASCGNASCGWSLLCEHVGFCRLLAAVARSPPTSLYHWGANLCAHV
jgi:hypothetical protein